MAVVAVGIALALSACGNDEPRPLTDTEAVGLIRENVPSLSDAGTDEWLGDLAESVCGVWETRADQDAEATVALMAVVDTLGDYDVPARDAGAFNAYAVSWKCPQYSEDLPTA